MRASGRQPRERKIRFSVTRRQQRAAEIEAARQGISVAELFYRRELRFLGQLERRYAHQLPPV